jgi:hypothetical protein
LILEVKAAKQAQTTPHKKAGAHQQPIGKHQL